MKLASGIAPVPEYLAAGVTVGLVTDGAASNNDLDMFEAMRFAALLHKVKTGVCVPSQRLRRLKWRRFRERGPWASSGRLVLSKPENARISSSCRRRARGSRRCTMRYTQDSGDRPWPSSAWRRRDFLRAESPAISRSSISTAPASRNRRRRSFSRQRRRRRDRERGTSAGRASHPGSACKIAANISAAVSPAKGLPAGKHLVQHAGQGPHVGRAVHRLAARLLRRHVRAVPMMVPGIVAPIEVGELVAPETNANAGSQTWRIQNRAP